MFQWLKNLFGADIADGPFILPTGPVRKNASAVKAADYPKSQYSVYWEVVKTIDGTGYKAEVRFNPWVGGGTLSSSTIVSRDLNDLQEQVNKLIVQKMSKYKVA